MRLSYLVLLILRLITRILNERLRDSASAQLASLTWHEPVVSLSHLSISRLSVIVQWSNWLVQFLSGIKSRWPSYANQMGPWFSR